MVAHGRTFRDNLSIYLGYPEFVETCDQSFSIISVPEHINPTYLGLRSHFWSKNQVFCPQTGQTQFMP